MIVAELLDEFDFREIEQFMRVKEYDIDFRGFVSQFINGGNSHLIVDFIGQIFEAVTGQIVYEKNAVIQILFLVIASAFLSNLAGVFENRQIADTGFFVAYILTASVLMRAFDVMLSVTTELVSHLMEFMRVLLPAYTLSMSLSAGTLTSLAFYEFSMIVMTLVDWMFLRVVIPMIRIYFVIMIINHISTEDLLSKMGELFGTAIRWCTKSFLGLVVGFHLIESTVLPGIDAMKKGTIDKIIGIIPGIGDGAEAVSQLVTGSGLLIKNGIGAAALFAILVICGMPIIKLALFSLMYQLTAAMVQPLADKRMTGSIACVAEGSRMLLQVAVAAGILFFFTVAIVCVSTNFGV